MKRKRKRNRKISKKNRREEFYGEEKRDKMKWKRKKGGE